MLERHDNIYFIQLFIPSSQKQGLHLHSRHDLLEMCQLFCSPHNCIVSRIVFLYWQKKQWPWLTISINWKQTQQIVICITTNIPNQEYAHYPRSCFVITDRFISRGRSRILLCKFFSFSTMFYKKCSHPPSPLTMSSHHHLQCLPIT